MRRSHLPLARFRISATTTDGGELPLGLPDSLASILATAEASARSDEAKQQLENYIVKTDDKIKKSNEALKEAEKPIKRDERLVSLEKRKESLSNKPTQDDPKRWCNCDWMLSKVPNRLPTSGSPPPRT